MEKRLILYRIRRQCSIVFIIRIIAAPCKYAFRKDGNLSRDTAGEGCNKPRRLFIAIPAADTQLPIAEHKLCLCSSRRILRLKCFRVGQQIQPYIVLRLRNNNMRSQRNGPFPVFGRFLRVYPRNIDNISRTIKITGSPLNRMFSEPEKCNILCRKIGIHLPNFKIR